MWDDRELYERDFGYADRCADCGSREVGATIGRDALCGTTRAR